MRMADQAFQMELPFDIAQSETSMLPGEMGGSKTAHVLVGRVWCEGERWHAELGQGWWVFIAGTREAAIAGVTRNYENEQGKIYA